MNAMLKQLSPRVVVTKFGDIARASKQVVSTNLPASELDTFIDLAIKAKSQPVATVSFVPPMVDTADPDVARIQDKVTAAVERSSARGDEEASKPTKPRAASGAAPATTGGSIGSLAEGYAANDADDLASAC
jgi:hypothetical protein